MTMPADGNEREGSSGHDARKVCPDCGYRGREARCPHDGLPLIPPHVLDLDEAEDKLIGQVVGDRYRIEERIGSGAMGLVFRATHTAIRQTLALKILRRQHAKNLAATRRFCHEARACSRLRHPNTIKVHDFGISQDGHPFIAMEYLEGASLRQILQADGPLAVARVVRIAVQVCKSLREAHGLGLIHRDLKPANIFLMRLPDEEETVKVLDFGLSKFVAGKDQEPSATSSGMLVGTPRYMSPEQIRGKELDGRSDLYSLGIIVFEMLAGRPPFEADSGSLELLSTRLAEPAPALRSMLGGRNDVPADLIRLVDQLLAREPGDRPATVADVLNHLKTIETALAAPSLQAGQRWTGPWMLVMAVALAALAVGLIFWLTRSPAAGPSPATARPALPDVASDSRMPDLAATPDIPPSSDGGPAAARPELVRLKDLRGPELQSSAPRGQPEPQSAEWAPQQVETSMLQPRDTTPSTPSAARRRRHSSPVPVQPLEAQTRDAGSAPPAALQPDIGWFD